ncbi:DNA translocase FtsK 4TM domain-containing protein [Halomonas sp. SSL-5]|uniref:DNA translocase FtsK n=1 Tax=Halomonas sp. SSL-5 TaxID=3065855 RepID=UPI0027382498|nr:DNA translocase FtsK 4TM domain-containing protein [Halomonas sp. SSL-5]MDY7115973.1 DNA translocase FtsK 4TM domain-containing protein [Halomonas sp. SSL-5]
MSVDKQTGSRQAASRRDRATNARESAKRFGVKLQGAAREGVVIVLLAACVFLLLAMFSYEGADPGWSRSGPETEVANWMGPVGAWLADVLYSLFGVSALWWPGMLGFAAWRLLRSRQVQLVWDATALAVRGGGLILLLLGTTTLGALHFYRPEGPLPYSTGGILGEGLVGALLPMVGVGGSGLLALAALLCGFPLFSGISWFSVMDELGRGALRLWGWVAGRFAFTREEAASPAEGKATRDAAAEATEADATAAEQSAVRPRRWQRWLPGRRAGQPATSAGTATRHEPGFGDDGSTEIPWEVPERTPSAKQPGAAYAARGSAPSSAAPAAAPSSPARSGTADGPGVAAGAAAGVAAGTARAASQGAGVADTAAEPSGADNTSPSAAARASETGQLTPTRVPESVPEPMLPDDDEPAAAWHGPALRASRDDEAPVVEPSRVAEAPEEGRVAPAAASQGPKPAGNERREPSLSGGHLDGDGTDDDEPRLTWDEPAVAEEAEAPAAVTEAPESDSPARLQPPEPEQLLDADEPDTPRVATAEQAREATEEEGMRLWTVEHLQNQRPVLDDLPEPDGELPSLRLLTPPEPQKQNYSADQLAEMAELLEVRLREYGVKAEVVDTWPGPVITRFEIKPAAGVKVSKISNLAKDLARSLMVKSVRVVEVIPGRPTVGIEIPNPHRAMIRLREVIDSDRYQQEASALTMALGQDIGGGPVVANLGKMPHLLVAGTTGSGKSVGVNAMLISMLLKATPDELRLIMVDPKMLELSVYDGIPHLLAPVVTDMKEAANALRWCVAEMERRYKLMAAMGVRNIAGFNAKLDEAERAGAQVADPLWEPQPWEMHQTPPVLEKLPYIVVVIDEFADMFMIVGKKVEELIARLAQKARAAGIHLILATQRPSVDVVTGLIKANIPTRMAFQVSSRVDSRTILDQGGAENLLGHGDMLYLPAGSGMPSRVHGAFVDDDEVHRVVEDWKRRGEPEYIEEILSGGVSAEALTGLEAEGGEGDDAEQDALYDEAVAFVTESRRASISAVQRRFKIGYNRAARLVEAMEMAGVVSTMGTNGAREVLAPPPAGG